MKVGVLNADDGGSFMPCHHVVEAALGVLEPEDSFGASGCANVSDLVVSLAGLRSGGFVRGGYN
jgi:hypothetical protein